MDFKTLLEAIENGQNICHLNESTLLTEDLKSNILRMIDEYGAKRVFDYTKRQWIEKGGGKTLGILYKTKDATFKKIFGSVNLAEITDDDFTALSPAEINPSNYPDSVIFWVNHNEKPNPRMNPKYPEINRTLPAKSILGITYNKEFLDISDISYTLAKSDYKYNNISNFKALKEAADEVFVISSETLNRYKTTDLRAERALINKYQMDDKKQRQENRDRYKQLLKQRQLADVKDDTSDDMVRKIIDGLAKITTEIFNQALDTGLSFKRDLAAPFPFRVDGSPVYRIEDLLQQTSSIPQYVYREYSTIVSARILEKKQQEELAVVQKELAKPDLSPEDRAKNDKIEKRLTYLLSDESMAYSDKTRSVEKLNNYYLVVTKLAKDLDGVKLELRSDE